MLGNNNTTAAAQTNAPPTMGITSAMKDLDQALAENSQLTRSVKECLGISNPEQGSAAPQPSGLAGDLRAFASRVWNNNAHLRDVLGHINS